MLWLFHLLHGLDFWKVSIRNGSRVNRIQRLVFIFIFLFYKFSNPSNHKFLRDTKDMPLLKHFQLHFCTNTQKKNLDPISGCIQFLIMSCNEICAQGCFSRVKPGASVTGILPVRGEISLPCLLGHNAISLGQPENRVVRFPLQDETQVQGNPR